MSNQCDDFQGDDFNNKNLERHENIWKEDGKGN